MLRPDSLLARAARLARPDRALAVEAALALTIASAAVRWCPRRWLSQVLCYEPFADRAVRECSGEAILSMIGRVANAHPLRPQCLETALAGRWMLSRRGQHSTLVIGAERPEFAAHAWLEIDGRVTPASASAQFHPVWRSA